MYLTIHETYFTCNILTNSSFIFAAVHAVKPENTAVNKSAWTTTNDTTAPPNWAVDGDPATFTRILTPSWPFLAVDMGRHSTLKTVVLRLWNGELHVYIYIYNIYKLQRKYVSGGWMEGGDLVLWGRVGLRWWWRQPIVILIKIYLNCLNSIISIWQCEWYSPNGLSNSNGIQNRVYERNIDLLLKKIGLPESPLIWQKREFAIVNPQLLSH